MPLDAPITASQRAVASPHAGTMTSHLPIVKNTHPPLAGFWFECRLPANEWMKMGTMLGFWSVGVL
jgi:hypothetical protein